MLAIKLKCDFEIAMFYGQVEKAVLVQNVPDERKVICLAVVILN